MCMNQYQLITKSRTIFSKKITHLIIYSKKGGLSNFEKSKFVQDSP